jgi:putative FmdB family regulatory protein
MQVANNASRGEEVTLMPHYVFRCQSCDKEFTKVLHMAELEKTEVNCPHCGSNKLQRHVAMFSAITSKKS